ncbi:MerR family transcriptional regulator [Nocardiopsis sediminis]|uniref:MerR family transcriptional regulator n=1 Tax=Nocardiopsis sediminis TaxID=1778267 RepID=A0ABV8FSJ1_9ACTN
MNEHELYPIGDAARRSGLSVSAVRFYADAGVVEPTGLNEAGHRMYDIDAVARLELVRTLRELDTDLDAIRRLLDGRTTLRDLLATHLEIVERQERTLRARRAVLRALIKQGGTAEQAALMHRLASMSDEEREQAIDEFWDDVSAGLDVPEVWIGRLRELRPVLPADPTVAQLEAWIELAHLVSDPEFRDAVRTTLHDHYSTPAGRIMAGDPVQDFIYGTGMRLGEELFAAYHAGESPRSPRSQQAVLRFMEGANALGGTPLTPDVRDRMADSWRQIPELLQEVADVDDPHDRYQTLVAVINGTETADDIPYAWIADAMSALELPPPDVHTR